MRTRTPHWKRALAVLLSMSLVLASVPAQAGKITRYVHTDHLGSVSAKTDSTGVVMMRRSFTPYGENEQAETDGPGYTGHYSDTGSGLVYMQQRYYDPEIGRFLSVDPVTFSQDKPRHFNRYWYANGNPYLYTDPDGRYPESAKEWKNFAVGAGKTALGGGMVVGGTVLVASGAVDVLVGSKVLGVGSIALGLSSVANAQYPFGAGLQEMEAAWNNESDSLDNQDAPSGVLGDIARKTDCSSACVEAADVVDTAVNVASGNAASTLSKTAATTNAIGGAVERMEEIEEVSSEE